MSMSHVLFLSLDQTNIDWRGTNPSR